MGASLEAAPVRERPGTVEEAAELLRSLGREDRPLRVRGGGTKLEWGTAGASAAVELDTGALDGVLEHNAGDFTAVLQTGVPLHRAQERFAAAGQMLALDPPLSADRGAPRATLGGVIASADSGPLRHRYGGPRDLVLGVTVVLSDGTVARAGGRVIKNVAGYDLGKLFTGSLGTLGLIATVAVRLHPRPADLVSVRAGGAEPGTLAVAAGRLAALPLEAECLDLGWADGSGAVLVRFGGPTALERAQASAARLAELGLDAGVVEDDEPLWAAQRALQRAPAGGVVKVAGVIADLAGVLRAARSTGATVAARAALGVAWVAVPTPAQLDPCLAALAAEVPGASLTVLDGAAQVANPWPAVDPGALAVMERIKARFDPARVFAPGRFVGGL
jgi:glycolate oxidase FAD binding subunit